MSNNTILETFISAADLSAKRRYAVTPATTTPSNRTQYVTLSTANEAAIGIIVDAPLSTVGNPFTVCVFGKCLAKIGDTVAVGDFLKTDSSGRLVPAALTEDNNIIARAEKAGVVGDEIDVFVSKFTL